MLLQRDQQLIEQMRAGQERLRQALYNPAEFLNEQARAAAQVYGQPLIVINGWPEPEDPDEDMPGVEDQE